MTAATTEPTKLSPEEVALQRYLLGTTIPLKEGGGVVFPGGFFSVGYRLDEWQFDRYRAAVDQTMLSAETRKRKNLMIGILLVYLICVSAIAFAMPQLRESRAFAPYLSTLTPLFAAMLAAAATLMALRFLRGRALAFTRQFEDAPRVSRFAFLNQRAIRMLASGGVKITAVCIRIVIYGGLCFVLLTTDYFANDFQTTRIFVAGLLLWSITKRLYFLFVYCSFRIIHGRAPATEDLEAA